MQMMGQRLSRGARSERGAVAILMSASLVMLLVVTAMVLDFGLVRVDRQKAKSAADSAVMAGLRAGDGGTERLFTFRAVCGALDFLKTNNSDLAGLPGAAFCSSPISAQTCDPANPTAPAAKAEYTGTTTNGPVTSTVTIKAPYDLDDGQFPEEAYNSVVNDDSQFNNCDQLAVIISKTRTPGLGSLATSGKLRSRIRSVGRVLNQSGDKAPALLLLERLKCPAVKVTSNNVASFIKVVGSATTPGSIHSDTAATGSGCGTGTSEQAFLGNHDNGIVAMGSTDGQSGQITSVATFNGRPSNIVSDGTSKVYGTTGTPTSPSGTTSGVGPLAGVTRKVVDVRYAAGLRTLVSGYASKWSTALTSDTWAKVSGCNPNAAELAAASLYIDCPGNSGITIDDTIQASKIFFNGFVKNGRLRMPNATNVYINNPGDNDDAMVLSNSSSGFCVRSSTCGTAAANYCPAGQQAAKATVMVRSGSLNASGGMLRLCNTTVLMLSGQPASACIPAAYVGTAPAPSNVPCGGGPGSGQLKIAGGALQDWTAPNATSGIASQSLWDGQEDLAFWSESYGDPNNPTFSMAGGGNMRAVGVFMAPNANPFQLTGNGAQVLTDAQYVVASFQLSGQGSLTLSVDPNNAVTFPKLGPFYLIR